MEELCGFNSGSSILLIHVSALCRNYSVFVTMTLWSDLKSDVMKQHSSSAQVVLSIQGTLRTYMTYSIFFFPFL